MAPPTWAYQVDNFNPPPDEELICSICQAVFCDPVQSPCNHVFCRTCITKWLESNRNCPICRKRTTRSTIQEVVPLVKNMIMKLTVICHNSSRGCVEKFTLESCESHVKECPYELVQCKNKPCKSMFMKKELQDHELNNCPHSFIRCKICQLKMPSRKPKAHNCIEELQKKLKEKTEKLKKNNQKIKKLKEELKKLKANNLYVTGSSDSDSLSTADVLFSLADNSNIFSSSSISSSSIVLTSTDQGSDDDDMWPFQEDHDFDLSNFSADPPAEVDDSVEFPRFSSPITLDDSSVLVVEPAEPVDEDDEPQVRRPPKRRLNTHVLDSTDDDNDGINVHSLPLRKRTWQNEGESSSATGSNNLAAAGPSYLSSPAHSNNSTNDSSTSSNRKKFSLRPKSKSKSTRQNSSANNVAVSSTAASHNNSPIFERTISLLEQYNLDSDPEWLPTHHETSLEDSDNEPFMLPGHITSSDESSITDLDSESSYEDAAEGRTEDLLNRFYGSSDSDSDDWVPE